MKKYLSILLLFVAKLSFAQLPILVGSNGNNTGVTLLQMNDSVGKVKNLLTTDYSTKKMVADSSANLRSLINASAAASSNQVSFWAANTSYLIGQPVMISIVGQRVLTHSFATRTSGSTLDATEMSGFVYQSQSRLGTWQSSEVYPAGFQILRTVNGQPTILENQLTHLGELTFDATESARWTPLGTSYALPSQTGNAGKVLSTDGTNQSWVDKGILLTNGGVGAPVYTSSTSTLNIPTVLNSQKYALQTTTPTVTNDTASLYFRQIAERRELAYVGKFNDVSIMQRSFNNRYNSYIFSNGTNGFNTTGYGGITTSGTIGAVTLSAGSYRNHSIRTSLASAATAGAITFIRSSALEIYGGENVVGIGDLGGYYVDAEFGLNAFSASSNFFIGIHNSGSNPSNLDATTSNALGKIGIAFGVGTGNMKLVHNVAGTTPTVIDLTHCPINATDYYRLVIYNPANSTSTYVIIVNLQTNVTQNFTITTNKPTNATFLSRCAYLSNDLDAAINTFVLTRFNLEAR